MSVGHGTLGLRSGLRSFRELTEQSYCGRRAYLDLPVGRLVDATTWALSAGAMYLAPVSATQDGVTLVVVAVETLTGDHLAAVESSAMCQGTAGSYYHDGTSLYVRLSDDANPSGTEVLVSYLRRFGTRGSFDPVFGPERLANGGFETYTGGSVVSGGALFTSWTQEGTAVERTLSPEPCIGVVSVRLQPVSGGLGASAMGGLKQTYDMTNGVSYILSGAYRTDPHMPAGLTARIRVLVDTGTWLDVLGRNASTAATLELGHALSHTGGQWRRFVFAFRCTGAGGGTRTNVAILLTNASGGAITTGWAEFDAVSLRAVYRYEYAEPRLSSGGLPAVEIGNSDPFMGAELVGLGSVRLLNSDDGYMEDLFGDFDVIGRKAQLYLSGAHDDSQEITGSDWWAGFGGVVQAVTVSDQAASLDLQDLRSLLAAVLPQRRADRQMFPAVSSVDEGKPRALLFGRKTGIRPIRIGVDATTNLPLYEVVDTTDAVGTAPFAVSAVYAYLDQEAADQQDTTRRVTLSVSQYSATSASGRVQLTNNPGPFVVVGAPSTAAADGQQVGFNDAFDVSYGGTPGTAYLNPGVYTADTLATEVARALNVLNPASFTCTYSTSTHTFTIGYSGIGTLSLLLSSGTNVHRGAWALLGFTATADKTGATSYASDVALYASTQADAIVLRVDASGHTDDASGTYTGTAAALIERAPDVLRFLLRKILKRPATEIDATSFVAGRTTTAQILGLYLGGAGSDAGMTLQEVIDRLEASCHADAVIDGSGVWYWSPRGTSSATIAEEALTAPVLRDRDILSFETSKSADGIYEAAEVHYDQDPSTDQPKTVVVSAPYVRLLHGRSGSRGGFPTFLRNYDDALAQAWNLLLLGVISRRRVKLTTKGLLLDALPGDLVRVQRTRMMGAELAGMANEDVFRILRLRVDPLTHVVEVEAYTADMPRISEFASSSSAKSLLWPRPAPKALPLPAGRREILSTRVGLR